MPPLGPIPLALALATTLLLGSVSALGALSVGDSGQSHESIWRVTDIGLYMDKSFLALPGAGDTVIDAIETWREADSRLPHVWPIVGSVDDIGYRADQTNRNTIRYSAAGEPRAKGALAITLVTYDGDTATIRDADIVINGIYQFDDNGKYCGQRGADGAHNAYDLGDVLAHEMGHWFGLPDDTTDSSAIMYPYFDPGETRRKRLSDSDKQTLAGLYDNAASDGNKASACSVSIARSRHHSPQYAVVGIGLIALTQVFRRRLALKRFASVIPGWPEGRKNRPEREFSSFVFRDV